MEFDPNTKTLRFSSDEELHAFHSELTGLLREVTISLSASTKDAERATALAREVIQNFRVVADVLNALRRHMTRKQ